MPIEKTGPPARADAGRAGQALTPKGFPPNGKGRRLPPRSETAGRAEVSPCLHRTPQARTNTSLSHESGIVKPAVFALPTERLVHLPRRGLVRGPPDGFGIIAASESGQGPAHHGRTPVGVEDG